MSEGENWWSEISAAAQKGDFTQAQALIVGGLEKKLPFERGHNIYMAHLLILAAQWAWVDRLLPARTNFFRTSGWLQSLWRGEAINAAEKPIPWLTYPAIDFLEPRIRPEWTVLEWGCGSSTLWWSERVKRIHAIENDEAWHKKVSKTAPGNCSILLQTTKDGYANAVRGELYDVMVIDGSWRNDCALAAAYCDAKLIIFDNTDVREHDEGVRTLTKAGWSRLDFFGLIPSYAYKNCTSIFFKDPSVLATKLVPTEMILSSGPTCSQSMDADAAARAAVAKPG